MNDLAILHAARSPKRCRRHMWGTDITTYVDGEGHRVICQSCGKEQDPAVSRRSRNNRKRGGSWERDAAADIGGRRMGQLNLPHDVEVAGYARIQTKVLDRWPSLTKILELDGRHGHRGRAAYRGAAGYAGTWWQGTQGCDR